MKSLVQIERLKFPREVVQELKKYAGADNPALEWAIEVAARATTDQPSFEVVRQVLAAVPEVLDPHKEGEEEADPYVLAMALSLRKLTDARIVTDDVKATGLKMSLAGAAGYFGIPSVPLNVFTKFEGFDEWA